MKVKLVRGWVDVSPPSAESLASLSVLNLGVVITDQWVKDLLSLSISEVPVQPLDQ